MKKQFRLFDIYRSACGQGESQIRGIKHYFCKQLLSERFKVFIQFEDDINAILIDDMYYCEDELKDLVSCVNRVLGNCHKPGRRKHI